MSNIVKYQKFILDVMLTHHYALSYQLINESKEAQLELIYKRAKRLITSDVYKQHHYVHMTRQSFLESEIDKVRQSVTEAFITGLGSKNGLAKSTALADYSIVKGVLKTYVYDISHFGLLKKQVNYNKLSERETKLQDFKIKANTYAQKLLNEEANIKEVFDNQIQDRVLAAICSHYLIVISESDYLIPVMNPDEIQEIIENHISKVNRKEISVDTPIKKSFLDHIEEKKDKYLSNISAEQEKTRQMANPKTRGNQK